MFCVTKTIPQFETTGELTSQIMHQKLAKQGWNLLPVAFIKYSNNTNNSNNNNNPKKQGRNNLLSFHQISKKLFCLALLMKNTLKLLVKTLSLSMEFLNICFFPVLNLRPETFVAPVWRIVFCSQMNNSYLDEIFTKESTPGQFSNSGNNVNAKTSKPNAGKETFEMVLISFRELI